MIFFPGSTFGINEVSGEDIPEVKVHVYSDRDNSVTAYVSISLNDRICEATETVSLEQEIAFATHECIAVGCAMFAAGKEMLGHIPPWGILTGIRPAKVAGTLLLDGKGIIKSKRIMRDEYFLNPQKAALAVSVASSELKLLKKIPPNSGQPQSSTICEPHIPGIVLYSPSAMTTDTLYPHAVVIARISSCHLCTHK
jgi:oxygen-independent coproporphyrinogen-3 oxidase